MKALLYCTKSKPYLYKNTTVVGENIFTFAPFIPNESDIINGTIPCECDYEVDKISFFSTMFGPAYVTIREEPFLFFSNADLLKASCLQDNEMIKYLGYKDGKAIHIKNLHIFDEPKDINHYDKDYTIDEDGITIRTMLMKAPQNMIYVFDGNEKKVLIPIRPEYLCKILNGNKTIEVRKKVLKDMYKK